MEFPLKGIKSPSFFHGPKNTQHEYLIYIYYTQHVGTSLRYYNIQFFFHIPIVDDRDECHYMWEIQMSIL